MSAAYVWTSCMLINITTPPYLLSMSIFSKRCWYTLMYHCSIQLPFHFQTVPRRELSSCHAGRNCKVYNFNYHTTRWLHKHAIRIETLHTATPRLWPASNWQVPYRVTQRAVPMRAVQVWHHWLLKVCLDSRPSGVSLPANKSSNLPLFTAASVTTAEFSGFLNQSNWTCTKAADRRKPLWSLA